MSCGGTIEVAGSEHALLQMDTLPDDPPTASTVMHSVFQNNQVALKAVRYFGAERIRSAVAVVSGVSYDSP